MKTLFVSAISLALLGAAGAASAAPVVYEFTGVIDSFDLTVPEFTGNVGDSYSGTFTFDTATAHPAGANCRGDGVSYSANIGGLDFNFVSGGLNFHCTGFSGDPNAFYFYDELAVAPIPYGLEYLQFWLNFSSDLGGPTFSSDLPVDDFVGGSLSMLGSLSSSPIQEMSTHITSLTRVPEPGTGLLLGIGVASLLVLRRRPVRA